MPSYCYFSCDEAWRKILLLILICDILSLCAQWTFSALQFICDLHSQRVRWMIIDIHVSLWRINLFHVRAHLHHITPEYMHSNRKKALLWLMCLSASTCHVSSSRARVRYITLKWFFSSLSLLQHSLSTAAPLQRQHLHIYFHSSALDSFQQLNSISWRHSHFMFKFMVHRTSSSLFVSFDLIWFSCAFTNSLWMVWKKGKDLFLLSTINQRRIRVKS